MLQPPGADRNRKHAAAVQQVSCRDMGLGTWTASSQPQWYQFRKNCAVPTHARNFALIILLRPCKDISNRQCCQPQSETRENVTECESLSQDHLGNRGRIQIRVCWLGPRYRLSFTSSKALLSKNGRNSAQKDRESFLACTGMTHGQSAFAKEMKY